MKRLRWFELLWVNLFWLGMNYRNAAMSSIFLPYLVAGFVPDEIKNSALGGLRAASLVVAMVVQPAAGILSDRSTSRFGRRRPYILMGVLLDVVFLAAIGFSQSYAALLAAVLLLQFSANLSHGALQGLIPDLVPEEQRGRASAIKAVLELLPIILVSFSIAQLVGAGQVGWAIAATGAVLVLTTLLTLLLVREEPLRVRPNAPLGPVLVRVLGVLAGILAGAAAGALAGALVGGLAGLIVWPLAGPNPALAVGTTVGGLVAMAVAVIAGVWAGCLSALGPEARRRPAFAWWVANRLMFLAAVTSIQGFAPFFLMHVFGIDRGAAARFTGTLMMAVGLATVVAALPGGWLSDRLGAGRTAGLAGVMAAGGTGLLLVTVAVPRLPLIYLAGCVIGLGSGLFMTANWALGTDLVPADEAGRYLGISNLAGAGAGMIGAGIGGPLADQVNRFQPGQGYTAIFAIYAVMFLLSVLLLRRVVGAPGRRGEVRSGG